MSCVDSKNASTDAEAGTSNDKKAPDTAEMTRLKSAADQLRTELSKPEKTTKNKEFYLPSVSSADSVVSVTLRKRGNAPSPGQLDTLPDAAAIKQVVVNFLSDLKIDVKPENVTVTQ